MTEDLGIHFYYIKISRKNIYFPISNQYKITAVGNNRLYLLLHIISNLDISINEINCEELFIPIQYKSADFCKTFR